MTVKPLKIVDNKAVQTRWRNENPNTDTDYMLNALGPHAYRIDRAASIMAAMQLIESLADEYTGRDSLALLDCDIGQEAEEILAAYQSRKPMAPD